MIDRVRGHNGMRPVQRADSGSDRGTGSDPSPADRAAFARRFLPHLDDAYRYARYLARDAAAAEDIVHDAFLRALKAQASCHGSEKAWLFAIVRNCTIDWRRATPPGSAQPGVGFDEPAADGDTPDVALDRQRTSLSVREAIDGIPEPFREAIILREFDELSYREIAAITGAPIGTVMSRLARARGLLATLVLARGLKERGE